MNKQPEPMRTSKRKILCSLSILVSLCSGCALCCSPFDYDYPVFEGGRYTRVDPQHGRVGSLFSDPTMSAPSVTTGEPTEATYPPLNPPGPERAIPLDENNLNLLPDDPTDGAGTPLETQLPKPPLRRWR